MSYNDFFYEIQGFPPYKYQEKVSEHLLSGKNVILSVPTGAGKTWASVMPFLYAKLNQITDFPQKMIYSLPLRTLANSIYKDIDDLLKLEDVHSKYPQLRKLLSIQTGEYCDDPYFEKDIVFSTIDQTLSNFLSFPLALSHNQANINAGAIIGSYLVFDEFHLLDPKLSMATTIGMLRKLKNLCRICIMTATLTDEYIQFLKKELTDFEVVSISDFPNDKSSIKSLKPAEDNKIKKSVVILDEVLNAETILKRHKNKTIVICNRVESSQRLFLDLNKIKKESTKLICIHSRFFDSDRKQKENEIKQYFGKSSKQENVILIATQVIEAGMDISCDVMLTEISPINSFLQRAGRCARFAYEYGEVFVCDVLSIEEKELLNVDENELTETDKNEIRKINNKYLPYSKELCQNSLSALKSYSYLDEIVSEKMVNDILTDTETDNANSIIANQYNSEKIRTSWLDCDKKHYSETIRDIQSIELILFDVENNHNEKVIPWKYETISVYRWSFIGWIKKIREENIGSEDWIIAKAETSSDSQFDDEWDNAKNFYLRRLDFAELKNHYEVVFVDNRYFDYDEVGLYVVNNENQNTSPVKHVLEKENNNITFKKDSYYQHCKALLNCYEMELKSKMEFVFQQLNLFWGETIDWDKLIKIVIVFHDYGKLNDAWQKPMLEYQRKKMNDNSYFEILAHTDYDESVDAELATICKIKNKPAHAGIGAMQVYEMLIDDYGEKIARIAGCAILKHHGVDTNSFVSFAISDKGLNDTNLLAKEYNIKGPFKRKERGESLSDIIPNNGNDKEWLLYLLIVRILRLCDQKATESMEKYYTI